ncbi:hypothetical protein MP228_000705 [Amoeboaphelidium protococcarum]|nr:hypothetical protein MP228_000705 [Amoeboaphelidium protococcarum]
MKPSNPELKKLLDKKVQILVNANRKMCGTLRGYDPFLNIVLDDAVHTTKDGREVSMGTVVIRGNAVKSMECLERVVT